MVIGIVAGAIAVGVGATLLGGKKESEGAGAFDQIMAKIEGEAVEEALNDPTAIQFEEKAAQKATEDAERAANEIGSGLDPP